MTSGLLLVPDEVGSDILSELVALIGTCLPSWVFRGESENLIGELFTLVLFALLVSVPSVTLYVKKL